MYLFIFGKLQAQAPLGPPIPPSPNTSPHRVVSARLQRAQNLGQRHTEEVLLTEPWSQQEEVRHGPGDAATVLTVASGAQVYFASMTVSATPCAPRPSGLGAEGSRPCTELSTRAVPPLLPAWTVLDGHALFHGRTFRTWGDSHQFGDWVETDPRVSLTICGGGEQNGLTENQRQLAQFWLH